jgi:dephospho-CoA kinase
VLIVGLTGGIGSGKSTVSAMLADRGAVVIDVDSLGREVIAPGGRAEAAVLAAFGPDIADDVGGIDRAALARAVFGRPDMLAQLTAISHPAINAELATQLDSLPADAVVVLDMAILVESNLGRIRTHTWSWWRRRSSCASSERSVAGWSRRTCGRASPRRPATISAGPSPMRSWSTTPI